MGANPVIQELSSAASAPAAADAVVPPVGESAGLGVVRMQKLPWPGAFGLHLSVYEFVYMAHLSPIIKLNLSPNTPN